MDRNTKRNGLINFLLLLLLGTAVLAAARFVGSLTGQVVAVFFGVGAVIALVSWFQSRLEEREEAERLELEELSRTKSKSTLFDEKETAFFPARQTRGMFEKYFVTSFMVILLGLEIVGVVLLWRWLERTLGTTLVPERTLVALGLFGVMALILFMRGRFVVTLARLESNRLLRPASNFVLLGAYLAVIAGIVLLGDKVEFPAADLIAAKCLTGLLGLLALETLISLVFELYRPRLKGKVARPLYDSRLVGLLAQPEGLVATAAQTLDYQFGFKVSDTWFFKVLRERLPILLLVQLAVLLLSTCLVFIEAGEQGLLERFGKPVAGKNVLHPGAHFKLPWPVDKVYRYRTEEIQTLRVGSPVRPEDEERRVVLWTVSHVKEEVNYLVANRHDSLTSTNLDPNAKRVPPVSLLTTSIPIQYQVTNITDWAYGHESGSNALQYVATREVVRFLVSVDMEELMGAKRDESAAALVGRIQTAAEARKLGVRILHVGLQDVHPPVKVAPEYEKVVAAIQQKRAKIVAAQGEAIVTNALANAMAAVVVDQAEAERINREVVATARASAFTNQIPAYEAAPSVYRQRMYAQVFPRATAQANKYILVTTNTDHVITFDLQHNATDDMIRQQAEAIMNSK